MRNQAARGSGMLSNPILIGALTVLVTIIAVTLAYQANNGLPFVPRYTLYLQMANASEVTRNVEVHMGGSLVGTVTKVDPARDAAGTPIALLTLKLNKDVEPLPVDSKFNVRLKGAIGLKYLDLTKGTSTQTYRDGSTVPLTQSSSEVDLDQVLSMFDPATRKGIQESTIGFSDALASRGSDINDAIGAFRPLVRDLQPVAHNLASPKTDLGGFFRGLEAFSGALAPVAQTQADLYTNLDTTFRAIAPVAEPYPARLDPGDAADVQRGDSRQPRRAGVPAEHRRAVQGAAARVRHVEAERAGARRRVRHRDPDAASDQGARRPADQPVQAARALRADTGGQPGPGPPHADRPEPAVAAGLPDPGSVDLQLRVAVPAQHRQPAV